jgi:hypothetical protein
MPNLELMSSPGCERRQREDPTGGSWQQARRRLCRAPQSRALRSGSKIHWDKREAQRVANARAPQPILSASGNLLPILEIRWYDDDGASRQGPHSAASARWRSLPGTDWIRQRTRSRLKSTPAYRQLRHQPDRDQHPFGSHRHPACVPSARPRPQNQPCRAPPAPRLALPPPA